MAATIVEDLKKGRMVHLMSRVEFGKSRPPCPASEAGEKARSGFRCYYGRS
jgi:hypothetical protein